MTREYDSLEAIERDQLNYDCYISGGDQCWNTVPSDFDWSYYLPFVKSGRKISYGISMGPFAERAITSREKIGSLLKTYDAISVREEGTKKMVDSLVGEKSEIHIDPALLITGEEWESHIHPEPIVKGEYILLYVPGYRKETYDMAQFVSSKLGIKVVTTVYNTPRCGLYPFKQQLATGPWEFLNLVKYAKLVVSGSFHALVFATLFHIPFFAVNGDKDNRMITFLNSLGLQKCTISDTDKEEKCKEVFSVDYRGADVFLAEERKRSFEYLKAAIEGVNGKYL